MVLDVREYLYSKLNYTCEFRATSQKVRSLTYKNVCGWGECSPLKWIGSIVTGPLLLARDILTLGQFSNAPFAAAKDYKFTIKPTFRNTWGGYGSKLVVDGGDDSVMQAKFEDGELTKITREGDWLRFHFDNDVTDRWVCIVEEDEKDKFWEFYVKHGAVDFFASKNLFSYLDEQEMTAALKQEPEPTTMEQDYYHYDDTESNRTDGRRMESNTRQSSGYGVVTGGGGTERFVSGSQSEIRRLMALIEKAQA